MRCGSLVSPLLCAAVCLVLVGVAAASEPAPSPILFTVAPPPNQNSYNRLSLAVPSATSAAAHAVFYASSGKYTIVAADGSSTTISDTKCAQSNCHPFSWAALEPGVFCFVSPESFGCAGTNGTMLWNEKHPYMQSGNAGVMSNGIWMKYQENDFPVVEVWNTHGASVFKWTATSQPDMSAACDASGWCFRLNSDAGSGCGMNWLSGNTSCVWTNSSMNYIGNTFGFVTTPRTGAVTLLITSGQHIRAYDMATGAFRYRINYVGVEEGPNSGENTGSGFFTCGQYIVVKQEKVAVIPVDAPQHAGASSMQAGAMLDSVSCSGSSLLVRMHDADDTTPTLFAFTLPEPADGPTPVAAVTQRSTWTFQNNNQYQCGGADSLSGFICGSSQVFAVDLFAASANEQYPWLASSGGNGQGVTAVGATVLQADAAGQQVVVFGGGNYNIVGSRITTLRAFGRNESFAAFGFDPVTNSVLTTVAYGDGLSRVTVPSMELLWDSAVVAGDGSANDGSSGTGSSSPTSPTFSGQGGVAPFTVMGRGSQRLAVADAVYSANGISVACFNAYDFTSGVEAWQYCMNDGEQVQGNAQTGAVQPVVHGKRIFTISSQSLYGFSSETGQKLWTPVSFGDGGSNQPYGLALNDLGSVVYVTTFDYDSSIAALVAYNTATGTAEFTTTLSEQASQVYPPHVVNGVIYVCWVGENYLCAQVRPEGGAIVQKITVQNPASNQDIMFTGGRCFAGTANPSAGVFELNWGTPSESKVVIAIPEVPLQKHSVQILGSVGTLFALLITDTSSSKMSVALYNLRRAELVWQKETTLPIGPGASTQTCTISGAFAFAELGTLAVQCNGVFVLLDIFTGNERLTLPYIGNSGSALPLIAAVAPFNTTWLAVSSRTLGAYTQVAPNTQAPDTIVTIAPVPPATLAPVTTTTPAPTTTTTTMAPQSTTGGAGPSPTNPGPTQPDGNPTTPPATGDQWTSTPAPPNPAADDIPDDSGPNPAALGIGITAAVLIFVGGITFFVHRQIRNTVRDTTDAAMAMTSMHLNNSGVVVTTTTYSPHSGGDEPAGYQGASGGGGHAGGGAIDEDDGGVPYPGAGGQPYEAPGGPAEGRERGKSMFGFK